MGLENLHALSRAIVQSEELGVSLVGVMQSQTHEVRTQLPWHRIVRADGSLAKGRRQRRLLVREGVPFRGEMVDMRVARLPE